MQLDTQEHILKCPVLLKSEKIRFEVLGIKYSDLFENIHAQKRMIQAYMKVKNMTKKIINLLGS